MEPFDLRFPTATVTAACRYTVAKDLGLILDWWLFVQNRSFDSSNQIANASRRGFRYLGRNHRTLATKLLSDVPQHEQQKGRS
jgi:hypothetical protein